MGVGNEHYDERGFGDVLLGKERSILAMNPCQNIELEETYPKLYISLFLQTLEKCAFFEGL